MAFRALLLATLLAAAGTAGAGTVEVRFSPGAYTDAGDTEWEVRQNLGLLGRYIEEAGSRLLPAGQALTVEVLDVDIAGSMRFFQGREVRMVQGTADFPRLHLKYALRVPGQPERTGADHVSDISYTAGVGRFRADSPLWYEKLLVEKWLALRFGPQP